MTWFRELKKDIIRRRRLTPAGRAMLNAAAWALQPVDSYQRRRAAARYNQQFHSDRMTLADGYALLPSGSLPGTAEIIDTCRQLFMVKKAALEASAPTGKEAVKEQRKKRGFLKNLLDNDDLRAAPLLVDFALSDPLLSIVTNYLGMIPRLTRVDLVYSLPRLTPDEHIASQLFHQDPEGVRQAKVFLYVFDVNEENGPFMFIPASRSEEIVPAIRRQRRQAGARDEVRYRDEELHAQGGLADVVRLKGPAGTALVVDTSRCLHAGSRIRPGYFRLCLFIQYCTTRENAHTFDTRRFRTDPVRWLAVKPYPATAKPEAPRAQMS
jgi:ectoine hydroxylase-related dioxygenase (phytanoyl-CoA dioxygenase family)